MKIPIALETSTDFANRVAKLIQLEGTRLYIDTSFLMWMTKIGRTSRRQLLDWLAAECVGRVHIPVWAAHEYLRHHVAGTIVGELDGLAKELSDVAGRTYANLRPFLDDPLEAGVLNAETQQVAAREALNELQRLAVSAKHWHDEYKEHAAGVIAFINAHVPDKTPVFEYMSDIEALSVGRFNGRVPPGFQDRRKKEQSISSTDVSNMEVRVGSNRWGDLIFWKEILAHAAETSTKTAIILTNDRKNDWYMGGVGVEGVDEELLKLKARWKPVPCAHPMLSLEARINAGVDDIVLLDAPYLGALLRTVAGDLVKAFVDVAIVPDPPQAPSESERRKELLDERLKQRDRQDAEKAIKKGLRFLDGPEVADAPGAFARALFDSRNKPDVGGPVDVLLRDMGEIIEQGGSVDDLLTKGHVQPLNNSMLAMLARELHDRGLEELQGYDEALTDLISTFSDLPEFTAASLYLGLIASMYLERSKNQPRLPPRSPIASLLFERQEAPYAVQPITTLRKRFEKLDRRPLYLLDMTRPPVEVRLDIVPDTDGEVILGSLRLAGEEVLTRAQGDLSLRLYTIFEGRSELLGREVVKSACELFGVPFDQVNRTDNFERPFKIDPTAGFKSPRTVYVDNEELD